VIILSFATVKFYFYFQKTNMQASRCRLRQITGNAFTSYVGFLILKDNCKRF
jgi:hypothetical protein